MGEQWRKVQYCYWLDIIDLGPFFEKSSSQVLMPKKLLKKGSRNNFLLKKVIAILRSIFYYCVSTEQYLTEKVYIINVVPKKWPQIRDNFLK